MKEVQWPMVHGQVAGEGDAPTFRWLFTVRKRDDGDDAWKLGSTGDTVIFDRDEDALMFIMKFGHQLA